MIKATVEQTFTFDESDVKELIAEWVKTNHNLDVDPKDIVINITPEQLTGFREDIRVPPKFKNIQATAKKA